MPMNPSQMTQEVAELISRFKPDVPGLYVLYVENKKICISKYGYKQPDQISVLNSKDFNEGLTREHWDQIQDKIAIFQAKGIL